jgi:GNAT superfamily N-acetyltransferase
MYELASSSLVFDNFSQDLLREKLFENPDAGQFAKWVYVAEQNGDLVGLMQGVERASHAKGWLGLFVVRPASRRQGIATALFDRAVEDFRQAGLHEIEALAIPGNYFNPGLDPRYTPALCFLEAKKFERFKDCVNLAADLSNRFDTRAEQQRLDTLDITVRRADDSDGPLLDAFFAEQFGPDWRMEAALAMRNNPPALHLALKEDRVIAFSGHSSQNREWGFFGPMGTTPQARGTGIGRVLLWHCLNDMHDAGHRTSVIPWVGPIGFYSRYIPCRVDRVFWRYRLELVDGQDS